MQPVIRIEGLNSTNNPAHENASSVKRVFADSNGTLVIANNNQTNQSYQVQLPTTIIPAGSDKSVASQTFTLEYPSIVHVQAKIGLSSDKISDVDALRNGQARLFGSYYKFTSAPTGVQTNIAFGQVIIPFNTINDNQRQLGGKFYIEPRKDLYLPKGTYTLALYGYSQSSILDLTVNDPEASTGLPQPSQRMTISITPISY
ncbi:hypothetical protein ACQWU4_11390 [Chryseobacterium sp. MIQD13]|uniref:hypothetical protein n=1 Tax=Chryseobacterium sp. MIQD13 TaxID=3422310 RepID=UPI003D2A6A29